MWLLIALVILIIGLLLGIPVPFVFITTTIFLILTLGYEPSFLIPYGFSQLNNIVLLAVPLFIMAGRLMDTGGIAKRIVDFVETLVGKIKGGLGVVVVIACGVFGAISGSAAAALSGIGPILIPRLVRSGYSAGFATSLVASASVLSLLIPPSAIMILYAWVGNQSILRSFLATVGPGIILAILLSIINIVYMRRRDIQHVEPSPLDQLSFGKRFARTGKAAIPGLLMPIIILGGIYGGIMTPTEAAAVSVLYTIPVGLWIYKEMNMKSLYKGLVEAAVTTGVIMIMLYTIMLLSRIFITEDVPGLLREVLLSISENPIIIMLMVNVFLIIVGMLMDDVSAVLLSTPILLPLVTSIGVDPIHFAAIIGVNLGMGLLTPPTAPLLYLGSRTGKTPVVQMLGPTTALIIFAWLPTLLITTYIPEISLFLPNLLLGK